MPSYLCPECDEKVKVPQDDDRAFVRCKSCGYKIPTDDEDDRPRKKPKKIAAAIKKPGKRTFMQKNLEVLVTFAIVLVAGFVLVVATFFAPKLIVATLIAGWLISLFAFVRACMLATKEGNFISVDYLSSLGGVRILVIFFLGLYIMGYFILWYIVQIGCARGKPKVFLPWIGIQVYGVFLMIAGIVAGVAGESVWNANRFGRQNPPFAENLPDKNPPLDRKAPLDKNPPFDKKQPPDKNPPFDTNPPFDKNPPFVKTPPPDKNPPIEPPPAPRVTGDKMLDKLLADLDSKDKLTVRRAADDLAKMTPNEHQAVVAMTLARQQKGADGFSRGQVIRALGVWATAAEVPVLVQILNEDDGSARREVLQFLAKSKLRDQRLASPVAACLARGDRSDAELALVAMGPMAEDAVLPLLQDRNILFVCVPAINVLRQIGTRKSLPYLQAVIATNNIHARRPAGQAVIAINERNQK